MKITILADNGNQLRDEIARFIRRAGEAQLDNAQLIGGKRHLARCVLIAAEFNLLAKAISEMEVVSSAELFATKLPKAE